MERRGSEVTPKISQVFPQNLGSPNRDMCWSPQKLDTVPEPYQNCGCDGFEFKTSKNHEDLVEKI